MSTALRSSTLMAVATAMALSVVLPAAAQPETAPPAPPSPPAPPAAAPATPPPPAAPAAPSVAPDAPPVAPLPAATAQAAAPADGQPATPATPSAPVDPNAPPAQAAATEPPPPPPPPPELPTTGDGAVVTTLLTKLCEPLVQGGDPDKLAKAVGMAKDRRLQKYVIALTPKTPYQVVLEPQGANKNVCELTVHYALGWQQPIIDGLNIWRFNHQPQMFLHRNETGASISGQSRTTITWDNRANVGRDAALFGLIIVQHKNPDGSPVNKYFDEASVQFSIRKGDLPT